MRRYAALLADFGSHAAAPVDLLRGRVELPPFLPGSQHVSIGMATVVVSPPGSRTHLRADMMRWPESH